jgi:N,N'-diacetyllegionaminate synthase
VNYIIEVANTHGGDLEYLKSLISEFDKHEGFGMKFQPLHPDRIASPDFQWYPVYQELFFNNNEWSDIITLANQTKQVWLDLFDTYGVEILENNLDIIYGVKLQASILYNSEVIDALKQVDCSKLKLILNISAIELNDIEERVAFYLGEINPAELLIEVGFQSFPTKLEDSGLGKIQVLKSKYDYPIVFADHVDGKLEDAMRLPLVAAIKGADYIEKHVMHSKLETKYDHFSSIKVCQFDNLVNQIEAYLSLERVPFINEKEIEYLANSIQKPILSKTKVAGELIDLSTDISFRRSGQYGLSVNELVDIQQDKNIICDSIPEGATLKRENFKKANIATIIAGRLKSSRLKRKAILNIGAIPSIEKCIQSCLKFKDVNYTILATSTTEEDAELKDYTYKESVKFIQGDADDVIQRYIDAIDKYNIDIVIRVTADMPYASWEIVEFLLDKHFECGADYTASVKFSVGTSVEIINASALREVKKHFPNADYSEYMTWYFQNNKQHFKVNLVDLPSKYVRDYRLTVDYQEDLDMMNLLQKHLDENNLSGNLDEVFKFLDENPETVALNNHIGLNYKTDQILIDRLNTYTKIIE